MTIRRVVLLAVVGVLVGAIVWSLGQLGGSDSAVPAGGSPAATGGTPGTAPTSAAAPGGTATTASPSVPVTAPTSSPANGERGHGSLGTATEILPSPSSAASAQAGLPGLHPPRSTTAPLVTRPLPRAASSLGTLVAGYPATLAPPAGHTVASSSVSSSGDVLQVSLTGTCQRPCSVLRLYRARLAARGFNDVQVPSVENRPTAAFQRGSDSVTVTVTDRHGATVSYALFAVLSAERA